jgi:hypothetical protein
MTAILGFNCTDGILMLADSEESTSNGTKSESDKLYRFIFPQGTIVMGGSGDSHLIECAYQELQEELKGGFSDGEDIKQRLNAFTSRFFDETIGAYRGFASDLVPQLSMLIAISSRQHTWLFKWNHNRVVLIPETRHTSTGGGDIQMHPLLRGVQFATPCASMLLHGIRIMLQTKKIVIGVGGKIDALALYRGGSTRFFGTDMTRSVEDLLEQIERYNNEVLFTVISDVFSKEENDDQILPKLGIDIGLFREKYRSIVKP